MISTMGALFLTLATLLLVLALPIMVLYLIFRVVVGLGWVIWQVLRGLGQAVAYVLGGVGKGVKGVVGGAGSLVAHAFRFVRNEVVDGLRFVGAGVTSALMVPPVLANVFLGRWSAANHYGRALEREIREMGVRAYRVAFANPIRLFGMQAMTEGLEQRLPEVVAKSPGPDRPRGGAARFPGYQVVGALPTGGSGARLFLAEPTRDKLREYGAAGYALPDQVVIKSFSLDDGSTLPQIVRESRALSAARELGLVLDHALEEGSFYYVMPYVPGHDLAEVISEMHLASGDAGLDDEQLRQGLGHAAEILEALDRFHRGGLWHKDIKPTNVIVSHDDHAHLVDFGLVTPLRSAMTLTTHGTEYFRDPEIVRLAMKGVKVHEVDGVKFDLYSVGALLYAVIENSFPAHGSLSRIGKRCPDAVHWIIRRAMADTRNRYSSAREMLADLRQVLAHDDAFALAPADLPSVGGAPLPSLDPVVADDAVGALPASFAVPATAEEPPAERARRRRRRHPVHRGVVAALLLCLLVAAAGTFGFDRGVARRLRMHAAPVVHELAGLSDVLHSSIPGRFRAALGTPEQWRWTRSVPTTRRGAALGSELLVVSDLPPTMAIRVGNELREAFDDAGIDVRGLPDRTGGLDECDVQRLAEARRAIGPGSPHDEESLARLAAFLAADGGLDAVLWLAGGNDREEIAYRLVTRDGVYGDEPSVATFR